MLNSLKKKLILLYTTSTGFILTATLLFVMLNNNQQLIKDKYFNFRSNFSTVSKNVQMDNSFSHLWLSQLETKNHFIIHIEDNGIPLLFHGAFAPLTDRNILIQKLKKAAEEDTIDTASRPVSLSEVESRTYEIKGNSRERYLGAVFVVPVGKGVRSLVLLQPLDISAFLNPGQIIFLILTDVLGIGALFLVSYWIVGKSLKPVEESRRQQTEFIAAASHELKSPLAVIRASLSAARIDEENSPHYLGNIDKECSRMAGLIEDMLLLAASDAKHWQLKRELLDMDTLLIETYDLFYPFLKEKSMELKLLLEDEMLPGIQGDKERIMQILAVLIDNAAAYSREGDTVIIRAYTKKKRLFIEIEDHGSGIPEGKKKEVFLRFYRGDSSRQDKSHYGLGLSIAKELAEMQDGALTLNDTPGGGATFLLSLPF
ncbi:HAMP domain-containing sensor histidine kinase [Anaerocolumna sp. AGMB13020]|uniref:sensor histidine kinase n=1 Tax=Anaerocolumna sp. AGMB13020 TaxID=3081750 RepID=UPI0029558823|nr:HAMP domain-containing sensor histidine kinase [Anaerocolumna sp. AGMB13020]WOO35321.1 HAMP domain-containing sensor histidine kinase [Anaerocolumna sp. AGMB13020]